MNNPLFAPGSCWKQQPEPPVGPGFDPALKATSQDPQEFNSPIAVSFYPNPRMAQLNAYVVNAAQALAERDGHSVVAGNSNFYGLGVAVGNNYKKVLVVMNTHQPGKKTFVSIDINSQISVGRSPATADVSLMACVFDMDSGAASRLPAIPNSVRQSASFDMTPVYVAMLTALPYLFAPPNFTIKAQEAVEEAVTVAGTADLTNADQAYLKLSHLLKTVYERRVNMNIPGGNISMLDPQSINLGEYEAVDPIFSSFGFNMEPKTFGEARPMFADWAKTREWTPEEEDLIPSFPDDYPITTEVLTIARRYVKTRGAKRPMNNFLWRGITSFGKSTGVELIAALLHTPLVRVTCSSNMETQDFLSEFIPNAAAPTEQMPPLPSFEELSLDPEGAWKLLTGEDRDNVTADDCLKKMVQVVAERSNPTSATRYKHVESNFVKALARGYICEIQEISRIRDPGELVGLNEYDRPGAIVPLADGSYVRRHHDAMVIYTDNVGYASCRPVDPSVLRRMAFVIDSYHMDKDTVLARVKYNTGLDDEDILERMYLTWKKIQDYAKAHEITEGSVSVTELEMWAMVVLCEGGADLARAAYNTVRECVVAKATSVPEEQEAIMDSCVTLSLYTA